MAIKLKRDVINVSDELSKELELYGFQISYDPNKKEEKTTKDSKKKEVKKTTKK